MLSDEPSTHYERASTGLDLELSEEKSVLQSVCAAGPRSGAMSPEMCLGITGALL